MPDNRRLSCNIRMGGKLYRKKTIRSKSPRRRSRNRTLCTYHIEEEKERKTNTIKKKLRPARPSAFLVKQYNISVVRGNKKKKKPPERNDYAVTRMCGRASATQYVYKRPLKVQITPAREQRLNF